MDKRLHSLSEKLFVTKAALSFFIFFLLTLWCKAQQRRLNHFVKEYNHIRPHEALEMETPAYIHSFSTRPFPERIPLFDYESNLKVVKVTQNGSIKWKSYYWVYLTAALKGKYVGIQEIGNGIWKIFYRNVFLGFFNENGLRNKEKSIRLETNLV